MIQEKVTRLSPLFPKSGAKVLLFGDIHYEKTDIVLFAAIFQAKKTEKSAVSGIPSIRKWLGETHPNSWNSMAM